MAKKKEKCCQMSFCDDHPDEIAQVLCKNQKKLLCITCALQEKKNPEFSVIEIRNISSEQDTILYEGLLVRQIALKKRRLIEKHEHTTKRLQNELDNKVTEFHQKLIRRLNTMKTDCLNLISKAADEVIAQHKNSKQQLETFEREIAENLENLSADSNVDLSMMQKNLQEVNTKLTEKVPDLDIVPEGNFKADEMLNNLLSNSKSALGEVCLISQNYYEPVDEPNVYTKSNEVTETEMNKDNQHSILLSSDEVIYKRTTEPDKRRKMTGKGAAATNSLKEHQDGGNKKQKSKECNEEEIKLKKKRAGLFRMFQRKTSYSEEKEKGTKIETDNEDIKDKPSPAKQTTLENVTEKICEITKLDTKMLNHPRHLINKTASINGMRQHFGSACKFSKLVYLAAGNLGLLSKAHSSVVLTNTDGTFHAKITIPGLSDIGACGREQVATIKIIDKTLAVIKYKVSNKKFETMANFIVNADVSSITGFDFDVVSSKFAVSSPEKLVVFKTGTIEREISYSTRSKSVANEVVTAYDFSNDFLYVLDSLNKTLTCFSFARADYLWKSRIDNQHRARKLCLYEDKLCITYGKVIALFHAKNGKPDLRHDTFDLLDDCDGMCVTDGVIVFSSNSSDFNTSTKLAFISM